MSDYRPPLGNPQARQIVCVSNLDVPHGVGHNRVAVCSCVWCKREREMLALGPEQPDLWAGLDSQTARL